MLDMRAVTEGLEGAQSLWRRTDGRRFVKTPGEEGKDWRGAERPRDGDSGA